MRPNLHLTIILCFISCGLASKKEIQPSLQRQGTYLPINPYASVAAIPPPPGYRRLDTAPNSFGAWLRLCPLKKERTVYLYNGLPKSNQTAQFAVLDVSVGTKDLQQCADAIMRLRAEYLYSHGELGAIDFRTGQGTDLNFLEWAHGKRYRQSGGRLAAYEFTGREQPCTQRHCFADYLETVFSYCGTLSLEKQLVPRTVMRSMQIGDVLIRGGSPGHAMLVMDMAVNSSGCKVYLLAQSYLPAQDIHIVLNPAKNGPNPWYDLQEGSVTTPEWVFQAGQLRSWPEKGL